MPPPDPPSRPTFFGGTDDEREQSRGFDAFRLTWTGPGDATAFDLVFNGVLHADVAPGVTISGLTPNSAQSAAVRARNAAGEASDFSPALDAFTRPPTPERPEFVPGRPEARGQDSFTVTWPAIGGIPVYDARLDGATVLPGNPGDFPSGEAHPQFTVGGLPPNTSHSVEIRARDPDRGGDSFFSPPLVDFTRPPAPGAPRLTGDGEASRDAGRLQVTWDLVAGQDEFHYEYDLQVDDAEDVHFPERPILAGRAPGGDIDALDDPSRRLEPNVRYLVSVRARDDDRGRDSFFSPALSAATRPPRPEGLVVRPFGTGSEGLVFSHDRPAPFHLVEQASVVLSRRVLDGDFAPVLSHGAEAEAVFFDPFAPEAIRKDYVAEVRVDLPGFGENRSRPSEVVSVAFDTHVGAALEFREGTTRAVAPLTRWTTYQRVAKPHA